MAENDLNVLLGVKVDESAFEKAQRYLRGFEQERIASEQKLRAIRQQNAQYSVDITQKAIEERRRVEEASATATEARERRVREARVANARAMLADSANVENELTRIQRMAAEERVRVSQSEESQKAAHRRGQGWSFLGGQSFRTVGFQLRAIPGGGIAETLGRLAPLGDLLTEVATGTSAAGAGVLVLISSLVGFALAVQALDRQLDTARRQLTGALRAQKEYYDAIATMTSLNAREQIANLELVRDAQIAQIAELRGALAAAFGQSASQFGDLGARALDAFGFSPTRQLQEQLNTLEQESVATSGSIARLTQGLQEGAFAAQDMQEAEKRLADQRIQAFQDAFSGRERQYQQDIENQNLLREAMTTDDADAVRKLRESLDEQTASARQQEEVYRVLKNETALSVAIIEANIKRLEEANAVSGEYTQEIETQKEALAIAQAAFTEYNSKFQEFGKQAEAVTNIIAASAEHFAKVLRDENIFQLGAHRVEIEDTERYNPDRNSDPAGIEITRAQVFLDVVEGC